MRRLCFCVCLLAVVVFSSQSPAQVGCGSYDSSLYICCNGVLSSLGGTYKRCCGTTAYDPKYHICCNGVLSSLGASTYKQCCGTKAYDPQFSRCCNGVVVSGSGWGC